MRPGNSIETKIVTLQELVQRAAQWRVNGKTIVFTNGCFDLLHAGHIASFKAAAAEGDYLVVGLNADASIKKLKGEDRPVNGEDARALVLASLSMIDAVCIFDAPTPIELIKVLQPDVLVKGGDYKVEDIAGAAEVMGWGGRVVINPIKAGFSTTSIIGKLRG